MPSSISDLHCQAATFGSFHGGLSSYCNGLIVALNKTHFDLAMRARPKDMRMRVPESTECGFWQRGHLSAAEPAVIWLICFPKIGLVKMAV